MDRPFPAYNGDEPYVFVSYSHKDSNTVFSEMTRLKDQGINMWYDEGIEAGTEWTDALAGAIKQAKLFLYFVTPDSTQSQNCRNEVNFAVEHQLPIVAVHLRETDLPDGLSLTLSSRQAILKYEIPDAEYQQKLLRRIASYLDQEIVQPLVKRRTKSIPILIGVAGVLVLIVGLFFYAQRPVTDVSADKATEITPSDPSAIGNDKIDLAAMLSIAVLPFANMSTNEEAGFFADGLSEDILDYLAKTQQLKVASRSASFQFTERGVDPSLVGEELKVAYLLEGSVRQQGENVRITAQLIRTADGFHVWSKSYERTLSEGFEMQTAVAVNIAARAWAELGFDFGRMYGWKQNPAFDGVDPVAVAHFMDAQAENKNIEWGDSGNWDAVQIFTEKAVTADPTFFAAYWYLSYQFRVRHGDGRLPLAIAKPAATDAINKAFALAPDDYQVRQQLAQNILRFDLDYNRAENGFKSLLTENPENPFESLLLTMIDLREGRRSDARRRLRDLSGILTASQQALLLYAVSAYQNIAADYEAALDTSTMGLKIALAGRNRTSMLTIHAANLISLGRTEEAKPFVEESWQLDGSIDPEKYISLLAGIGEDERARQILADPGFELTNHFFLAMGYVALGDIDKAFESIRASIENQDPGMIDSLFLAPWWDPIRDDPRFGEMLDLLDSKVTHTEQYLHDQIVLQDQ